MFSLRYCLINTRYDFKISVHFKCSMKTINFTYIFFQSKLYVPRHSSMHSNHADVVALCKIRNIAVRDTLPGSVEGRGLNSACSTSNGNRKSSAINCKWIGKLHFFEFKFSRKFSKLCSVTFKKVILSVEVIFFLNYVLCNA